MKTSVCGSTNRCVLRLLGSVMTPEGIRPPVDGCDVKMMELRGMQNDHIIQFVVLVSRGALSTRDEVARLCQEGNWLEPCTRILKYGHWSGLAQAMAVRDLKEFLHRVDPEGKFSDVSDQVWCDSFGQPLEELQELLEEARELEPASLDTSLKVIDCRDLTDLEYKNLPLLPEWRPVLSVHRP